MSFYTRFILIMAFISLHIKNTMLLSNKELTIQKTGVETVRQCGVGLVLFADVNNTSSDLDYEVAVSPDECCVNVGSEEDCDLVEVVGESVDTVPRGTTKTFKVVVPLIDPFQRNGYCILYLESKLKNRQRGTMRDNIKINFDTRIDNSKQLMDLRNDVTRCRRIDEDPLNDCKPVDCETYYNGKKSYYDKKSKRCVHIPICVSKNTDDEVPEVIYDSIKNKCITGKSVSDHDVDFIKDLTGGKNRKPKDILILQNVNKRPGPNTMLYDLKNITNKISQLTDKSYKVQYDDGKIKKIKETGLRFMMAKYFIANKSAVLVFGGIILVQCCLICTMIYCLSKKWACCKKKKVVRKFFNYRQDASVTTPLICTSNIDTETTEFQYLSESSNIDKKIKCYKACQKERKNNIKMSMSDDILSKCLTRRDWNSKPAKSEAIPEITLAEDNRKETVETLNESIYQANLSNQSRKTSNVKVNFETEKPKNKRERKSEKIVQDVVKKTKDENDYDDEMLYDLSEKEIKCHSYNDVEARSNVTGFKPSSSKRLGFFKTDKSKKGTVSISTEKGAQASFSNDSIDDFLSERGLIFLAGEDLSKYSFSSRSNEAKSSSLSSGVSSKTSKNNNMVKTVLSLLHRKSKQGPSSEPGAKKASKIDLELIHMSRASVYSSNNDSDYLKGLKITKDSRSSL